MSLELSPRERWLAFMNAEQVDILPFWAKISSTYIDYRMQQGDDIFRDIPGSPWQIVDDCIVQQPDLWSCEYNGDTRLEKFIVPSVGVLELLYRYDVASASYYPEKHAISTREDIIIMTEWFNKAVPALDSDRLKNARQLIKDTADNNKKITCTCSGASPLLYFVVHLAGIENAHILLFEYPEETTELLNAALDYMCRRLKLHLEFLRPDIYLLIENMSTMLVSPGQFHDYVLPQVKVMRDICKRHGGALGMQMPGHISAILDDLAELGDLIVEGICSPPVGNTTLSLAREKCADLRIAGGTNAALWLESPESIIAQLEDELSVMTHHRGVAVTSSDMIPPDTPFATIVKVADFVANYKVK